MIHIDNSKAWIIDGQIDIDIWIQNLGQTYNQKGLQIILQAFDLAKIYTQKISYIGTSCLHQGMYMADILSQLNMDPETIAAGLIYSSVRHADLSLEDVEEHLGIKIKQLIKNVAAMDDIAKLSGMVAQYGYEHPKIDTIRKMFLAMVNDTRAVFIKFAEHLYILRNIKNAASSLKYNIAQETMGIYAPLANRLGVGKIKWEMEDLAFRYLEPEKYKQISQVLNQRRIERDQYVNEMIQSLYALIDQLQIQNAQVTGRAKHIYSIYRKMQRKKVDFTKIYDAVAIRVIVPNIDDCYHVLSEVHTKWKQISEEFDDYIATPKKNGYKSIHTVILGPDNKFVEIQVRTEQMHNEAELGGAAHWVYKEGTKGTEYESKIAWLRQIMDWQKEIAHTEEKLNAIQEIFNDRVYVLTPNGDIIDLPQGATPLDFAYHVHTNVGHRCRGAKVNGRIVTLTYQLKTGERIEILTTKEVKPSRDWLNSNLGFVSTSRAKTKIQHWFKQYDLEAEKEKSQPEIKPPKEQIITTTKTTTPIAFEKITKIKIEGLGAILTRTANCCQPKPGDNIIGYITVGGGVTVHRTDCFNVIKAQIKRPEKLVQVTW